MKDIFAEYEATSRTSTNSSDVYAVEEVQELESPASAETAMQVFFFLFSGILPSPCCFILLTVYTHFFFSSSKNYKVMSEHPKRRMNRRQGWTSTVSSIHEQGSSLPFYPVTLLVLITLKLHFHTALPGSLFKQFCFVGNERRLRRI